MIKNTVLREMDFKDSGKYVEYLLNNSICDKCHALTYMDEMGYFVCSKCGKEWRDDGRA